MVPDTNRFGNCAEVSASVRVGLPETRSTDLMSGLRSWPRSEIRGLEDLNHG